MQIQLKIQDNHCNISSQILVKNLAPRDKLSFARNLQCQAEQLLQVISEPFLPAEIKGTLIETNHTKDSAHEHI